MATIQKIRTTLSKPKDKIKLEIEGVYGTPCKDSELVSIEHASRRIKARKGKNKKKKQINIDNITTYAKR